MTTGAPDPNQSEGAPQLSNQDGEAPCIDLPPEISKHVIVETFIIGGMTVGDFVKKHGATSAAAKPSGGSGGEDDPHGTKSTSATQKK